MTVSFEKIVDLIKKSQSIILSTHREPDGDGLGAEVALFYALKKINKNVRILNVDRCAKKYDFLFQSSNHQPKDILQTFLNPHDEILKTDLVIILDTNDKRLLEPLYSEFEKNSSHIIFVDHHPILTTGPKPTPHSIIDTKAASTGEVAFHIIKKLGIEIDTNIAEALYTSIVFDTHLFRFIRNSSATHLIAAELLNYNVNPEKIHRAIFGDFTKNKLLFSVRAMNNLEFFASDKIAFLRFFEKDLISMGLNKDHTRDLIDTIMNIDSIEAAMVVREISENEFKVSFRSKGRIEVLTVAESLNGGGHLYASGAYVTGSLKDLKEKSLHLIESQLKGLKSGTEA